MEELKPGTHEPNRPQRARSTAGQPRRERGAPTLADTPAEIEALAAAVPDGVAIYDADGCLVRTNAVLRGLLALDSVPDYDRTPPRERAVTLRVRDRDGLPLPYERLPHVRALLGEVLSGSDAVDTIVTALDGRELLLSVTCAPILDPEGRVTGAVCVARDVTVQRRLERDLASSTGRLDAIFDAIPEGLGFFDAQGTPIRYNREARARFGADRHESLERIPNAYAVRTPAGEPFPLDELPLTRALRGEVGPPREMVVRTADGSDQIISVRAAPWFDQDGAVQGVVLAAHDITLLRAAERDAEGRASDLEAIFEALTDAVYVDDADGQLLRMNAAARALLDEGTEAGPHAYDQVDLTSVTEPRDTHGHPLPPERWPLNRVLRGEVLTDEHAVDMLVRTLDGRERQVSITGAPVRDLAGRVVRAVTIVRDVTEQRRLERSTRAALDTLLAMARTLVLPPVPAEGATGQGELAAPVGQRLVELTRDVLGCRRVGIVTFDLQAGVQHPVAVAGLSPAQERAWWDVVEGAPITDPEVEIDPALAARFFAGEVLLLDMSQPPFRDQPNPFGVGVALVAPMRLHEGVIGILSLDYGGAEHAYTSEELGLAGAVAQLAAFTLERERLLREREDARAVELALRETTRRMDEFLAVASHELKSPLTAMRGSIQLVQRRLQRLLARGAMGEGEVGATVSPLADMLERADQQAGRQARLINDLLDVSRIRSGHLELQRVPCDLGALVRDRVEELRLAWPARALVLDLPTDPVPVEADADRIGQVITNYVTNALKYSDQGCPVAVWVGYEGGQATVRVRDQGPGLTPEQQQHIWERYRRAADVPVRDSTHASAGGIGLGLYISRTIVEGHAGQVGVESVPGEGSEFWFALPTLGSNAGTSDPAGPSDGPGGPPAAGSGGHYGAE